MLELGLTLMLWQQMLIPNLTCFAIKSQSLIKPRRQIYLSDAQSNSLLDLFKWQFSAVSLNCQTILYHCVKSFKVCC